MLLLCVQIPPVVVFLRIYLVLCLSQKLNFGVTQHLERLIAFNFIWQLADSLKPVLGPFVILNLLVKVVDGLKLTFCFDLLFDMLFQSFSEHMCEVFLGVRGM